MPTTITNTAPAAGAPAPIAPVETTPPASAPAPAKTAAAVAAAPSADSGAAVAAARTNAREVKAQASWIMVMLGLVVLTGVWEFWGVRWVELTWVWIGSVVLLLAGTAAAGKAVNGRSDGVLIDNRNRVSLSKFQAYLWTVLVLSTLMTVAAVNLSLAESAQPLNVIIPTQLLAAMGLAGASMAATPVILSVKTNQDSSAEQLNATASKLSLAPGGATATGKLFGRTDSDLASWSDMFRGDEVGNAANADLSKLQQFAISLMLVIVYGAGIWVMLSKLPADPGGFLISALPALDNQFVWLLAVSHASYLAYKAAPHTPPAG